MSWDNVIGQERAVAVLQAAVDGRGAPGEGGLSLLLFGPRGVGKALAATCTARRILCPGGEGSSKIDRETHPDFLRLEPARGKRWITTSEAREAIRWMQRLPLEAEKKVLIVDPADALRMEAANALLKTLEEPPDHGVLILLAESLAGLPETVVSRCQTIRFRPLAGEALRRILEREGVDESGIDAAVRLARGSAGRALAFAREGGEEAYAFVRESLAGLDEVGVPETARAILDRFDGDREKVAEVIEMIAEICRDRLLGELGAGDLEALPGGEAVRGDLKALLGIFPGLWQSREDIASFVDPRLVLDKTLSDIREELR